MARDFRAKQVRTSTIIGSGSIESTKPYLGLAFYSGSKASDHEGGRVVQTGTVTIAVTLSSSKFAFGGDVDDQAFLFRTKTYIFDVSSSTLTGHSLKFSTTKDGTHDSGAAYTTGVTVSGTAGNAAATVTLIVNASAPDILYPYCHEHSGHGGNSYFDVVNLLNLASTSVGDDVWCVFDGSSAIVDFESERRSNGSTVLFLGDVAVSGSLRAERNIIEVDSTVAGSFLAPNSAFVEGNVYLGDQGSDTYALRVNPTAGTVGGITADTVQIKSDTTFKADGASHFGGGYGSTGLTIETDGDLKTNGNIQTEFLTSTNGTNVITLSNTGTMSLSKGITNTPAVRVSALSTNDGDWIKFASITETATSLHDTASALFLLRLTNYEASSADAADITLFLEVIVSANDNSAPGIPQLRAELFDTDNLGGTTFDPTTFIEMHWTGHDTNPVANLWFRTSDAARVLYASILTGNRDDGMAQSDMAWQIPGTVGSWQTHATSRANGGGDTAVFTPTLTSKKFDTITSTGLVQVSQGGMTLDIQKVGSVMEIKSSGILKLSTGNSGADALQINAALEQTNADIGEKLRHAGDLDTHIEFPDAADQMKLVAGGVEFVHITEDGSQDKIVVNPTNTDVDFIVLGNHANKKLINVDAENSRVWLGADASGNTAIKVEDSAVTINPNDQSVTLTINKNSGGVLFQADTFNKNITITGDADSDTIFKVTDGAVNLFHVTDNTTTGIEIGLGHSGLPIKIGHGTSEVTIGENLTVTGNLTINGTTTTVATTNTVVADPLIKLGEGDTGAARDKGIIFTRGNGSTNTLNKSILWDESDDVFVFAATNDEVGTTTGNVDIDGLETIRLAKVEFDVDSYPCIQYLSDNALDIVLRDPSESSTGVLSIKRGDIVLDQNKDIEFGNSGNAKISGTDAGVMSISSSGQTGFYSSTSRSWVFANVPGGSPDWQFIIQGGTDNSFWIYNNITDKDIVFRAKTDAAEWKDIARIDASEEAFAIDTNIKLTFDGATSTTEYISGDGTDLTLGSSTDINLSPTEDVVITGTTKLEFNAAGSGEHITGDGNDLTIASGRDIFLNATNQVVLGSGIELEFGGAGSGEHIVGDTNDITIASGRNILLSPTTAVGITADKPLHFDGTTGADKIVTNGTGLDIISGGDLNLKPAADKDINIEVNKGLTFGASTQKIEADGSNHLSLSAAGDVKSLSHFNIATSKELRFTDTNARVYRTGDNMMFRDVQQSTAVSLTDLNTRTANSDWASANGPNRMKTDYSISIDTANQYANDKAADVWFFVGSTDGTRNKSVFTKDLILSSSLNIVESTGGNAESNGTITQLSDGSGNDCTVFKIQVDHDGTPAEVMRLVPTEGVRLANGKGLYFNSSTLYLDKVTRTVDGAGSQACVHSRGHIVPQADSTFCLGDENNLWKKLFVDDIDLNGVGRVDLDADADTSIRASADDVIDFEVGGTDRFQMSVAAILPVADNSYNLGSATKRFANLYTGDLHLKNDRGDWTILEEEDFLCVVNNKTGKKFKMMLQPIEDEE